MVATSQMLIPKIRGEDKESGAEVTFLCIDNDYPPTDVTATPTNLIDVVERPMLTKSPFTGGVVWGVSSSFPKVPRDILEKDAAVALIQRLFLEDTTVSISKTAIHKILYRTKALASSNDAIADALPYYWYNFGPFSQIVEEAIALLKKSGVLMEVEGWRGRTRLQIRRLHPSSHSIIPIAEPPLLAAYQEYREKRLFSFVEGIYREDAPFQPFMPLYTHDYLKPLERVKELSEPDESGVDLSIDHSEKTIERIEHSLYDCEAESVDDPLFSQFNDLLSSLVTHASRVFRFALDEHSAPPSLLELTFKASEAVWMAFSHGVRIHPTAHDSYYNRDVQGWIPIYNSELKRVEMVLDLFADTVRMSIVNHSPPRCNPNEKGQKVLESILRGTIG